MKKLYWLLLFVTTATCSWCQINLDSLERTLSNYPANDTRRVDVLNEISFRVFKNQPAKALQSATEALALSQQLKFRKGEIVAKNNLAIYHLMRGNPEKALDFTYDAIRIGESEKENLLLADSYSILGSIYQNQKQADKALQSLRMSQQLNRELANVLIGSRTLNALGSIARDQKKYDSALYYFQTAISLMDESGENFRRPEVLNNIGVVYLRRGKLDLALEYFKQSNKMASETDNVRSQILSLVNIGNVLIEKKQYAEAEQIELESLKLAEGYGDWKQKMQIYMSLATVKMETGKHHEAHAYMSQHFQLKDSVQTADKEKHLAEVEARYETQKKDQAILMLQQQGRIQKMQKIYLLTGLGLVSLTFLLVYLLQKRHHNERENLLMEQKILNQKLQEGDQMKSKFLASISHEFRTPLSLILAPIEEKLSSQSSSPSDKESFLLVHRNANRLLSLVNELLDLSKLDAKKMELAVRNEDLRGFLLVATASFDSLAEHRKVRFSKHIQVELKEAWFDADKTEKIINNLLFNAFKFTPAHGEIIFSATLTTENDLLLKIKDSGPGISPEDQRHIFTPFYQIRDGGGGSQPGTGLGLSLVNELVKLYNGTIELDSQLGQGTTISITLPIRRERLPHQTIYVDTDQSTAVISSDRLSQELFELETEGEREEVEATEPAADTNTLLVVEDNSELSQFISSLLKEYTILTARDGQEGYSIAIERIPDLIISDVMMDKMDGITLAQQLKSDQRTSHIPIILLSAKADHDSRLEGLKAGVDDYLAKPFSVDELRVRVTNLIDQRKKLTDKYKANFLSPSIKVSEASLEDKFLLRARQIVEKHIGEPSFSVEQMAEEIHVSRVQLFRKLKAIAGVSPNEFINEIRLQKAAHLIQSKADTLTQIGYSVGFSEQSYFAKRFRKKFGVAPSEYKARALAEASEENKAASTL